MAAANGSGNDLSWVGSSSPDAAGYQVETAESGAGPWQRLTRDPVVATQFVDASPSRSGTTFYRVMTVGADGRKSAPAGPVAVERTTAAAPAPAAPPPAAPAGGSAPLLTPTPAFGPPPVLSPAPTSGSPPSSAAGSDAVDEGESVLFSGVAEQMLGDGFAGLFFGTEDPAVPADGASSGVTPSSVAGSPDANGSVLFGGDAGSSADSDESELPELGDSGILTGAVSDEDDTAAARGADAAAASPGPVDAGLIAIAALAALSIAAHRRATRRRS